MRDPGSFELLHRGLICNVEPPAFSEAVVYQLRGVSRTAHEPSGVGQATSSQST